MSKYSIIHRMLTRIFKYRIPFYAILISLVLLIAGTFAWTQMYRVALDPYFSSLMRQANVSTQDFSYGSWPALSNPQFFQDVKQRMIQDSQDFVEADLSAMKIRLYEKGSMIWEGAILTKGRPGSWWETPAGLYAIKSRQTSVFSGFGHVYMPEAMQFQGNFFIHGWPYYPDGTPVASAYSGGCIRLSTEDATRVFRWVKVGTPVLVYEKDFSTDAARYDYLGLNLPSGAYLAADLRSNFIFASRNTTSSLPIASLTKLMTALVATEYINLDKKVTITPDMLVYTSIPRLKAGESYTAYQLLYPLLEESSNEAAMALAATLGKNAFVAHMNEKAQAIGMTSTHFLDPAGMKDENVSTAEDLFLLAKYIYNNRNFVFKVSTGHVKGAAYDAPDFPDLKNFNVFADDPEFVGGKVGVTLQWKKTIISVFEHNFTSPPDPSSTDTVASTGDDVRPIVVIILGSDDDAAQAKELLSYVVSSYSKAQ
jgi:D-alanyl-D-alanine carboxypeptidase